MKLLTYLNGASRRVGLAVDDALIDPIEAGGDPAFFADTTAFIRGGAAAMAAARALIPTASRRPLAGVRLAAPMIPTTILCSGSNYRAHNAEKAGSPLSGREPEFFVKTGDCVIGPDEPIVHDPILTRKLDCETELAVVVGKPGRHIAVEDAHEHIFGYTIVNDVTARDRQVRRNAEGFTWYELGRGKAFDTSAPMGPVIVTADEFGDPQAKMLRTRINGELRQQSSTAEMIWGCADLVHFFSVNFTMRPGMVILTGTPAGTAWSSDTELGGRWEPAPGLVAATRYCAPGDLVESEIEGIGVLRNPVAAA
ncbi:fumarylacetoacetate hydrolase family protein [Rubrimonas sp.]|uniref:fumarylacetoacetate hydrolase family protein n=1 Tax=Rubrimonas sp. TaxID=2036015 RepID=UPI002FDF024B